MVALSSCAKLEEAVFVDDSAAARCKVSVGVAINDGNRVSVDNDWDLSWEEDDSLLAWSASDDYLSEFTYEGELNTSYNTFSGEVTEDSAYRLLYPYSASASVDSGSYKVDLSQQSAGLGSTYMISSDMLTTSSEGDITMQHIGSFVELTIRFPEGEGYDGATIESVEVIGLNSTATINLSATTDADNFYTDTNRDTITITDGESVVSGTDATLRFNILPTEIANGESVMVIVTTAEDATLMGSFTYSGDTPYSIARAESAPFGFNVAAVDGDLWTSHAAETFAGGTGYSIETTSYSISTEAELALLAKMVNAGTTMSNMTFTLTADLDLAAHEWVAIGTSSNSFQGTFDGGNHKITGLYINQSGTDYQGLFGYVYSRGEVKNVGVSGSVRGNSYVGGVVGYNNSSSKVTNCYNTGSVSSSSFYVGGVVGRNNASSEVTNCYNTGSVSSSSTKVGGVVGYNNSYSKVTNCYNTGSVSGSSGYVGGVVGGNYSSSEVTNCYNTGSVSGSGYIGGVVGDNGNSSKVTNCYNTGSVSGSSTYVGGVVGYNYSSSSEVTNCYNTGNVSSSSYSIGGVVGYNNNAAYVTNCYNTGGVSGSSNVGGVAGNNNAAYVTNCYWLSGTAEVDINGTTSSTYVTNTASKTSDEMQEAEFVTLINASQDPAVWVQDTTPINGYYPILSWQVE